MAHSSKRSRARQAVEALERPEGVSAPMWRGVVALLKAIADHYPNPYPSQQRLAALTGYDVRSIRRYVSCAKAHGLLLVKADAGKKGVNHTWSKTNRYLIVDRSECPDSLRTDCPPKPTALRASGMELRSSHSSSESSLNVISISRHDPEGPTRDVGPEVKSSRPKTPPRRKGADEIAREVGSGRRLRSNVASNAPRPPYTPPWRSTAARFMTEWAAMVESTTPGDHLRSVRVADTLGHFQRYLNAHFYGKEALTPKTEAEVAALISQFVDDAWRGRVKIKEGQSAWMAFTGFWGRRQEHLSAAAVNKTYVPPQLRS